MRDAIDGSRSLRAPRWRTALPPAGRAATTRARARAAPSTTSSKVSGTVNGAGSTFAAPVYQQWGSTSRTRASRSTTRPSAPAPASPRSPRAPSNFAGSDPALTPEDDQDAQEGPDRPDPDRSSAPSRSSYNVRGVDKGLKLDGETIADIFLGKIKKWNDPAIAALNPGVKLPGDEHHGRATAPTSRARRRASRRSSSDYQPGVEEQGRRRQDRQVADRHRRQGQRRRRRRGQADRRRGRLRRAGLRAAEQLHDREREEQGGQVHRARRWRRPRPPARASKIPADLRHQHDQRARARRPTRSRRRRSSIVYKDLCKAGMKQGDGAGLVRLPGLRPRRGPGRRSASCPYAKLPAALLSQGQGRRRRHCTCNGSPISGCLMASRGTPSPGAAAAGGSLARERSLRARLPDRRCAWVLDGSGGGDPGPDRVLLHPPDHRGAAGARQVRASSASSFDNDWDVVAATSTARCPLVVGHADHLGDRAGHRRAGRGRHRAVPHRAVPAPRCAAPLTILVELLAAVPSVVYGLWGVFVLDPEAQARRAVVRATRSRSCRSSAADVAGPQLLHRRADPGDHDPADRLGDLAAR